MSDSVPGGSIDPSYQVLIPCSQDRFADFVAGLLGSPQTLEKIYHKAFELTRNQVESTFHLVDQRVRQQNDASLVQFSVRIGYDDDSSVLLDSLADFTAYAEVKPLVVVSTQLRWTYLIRFQDRDVPEKQTIELAFQIDGSGGLVHVEDGVHLIARSRRFMPAHVRTRIVHTARTWATDIDSLLDGHIKTLTRDISGIRNWIYMHDGTIALAAGLLFLVATVVATYFAASSFVDQQYDAVVAFLSTTPEPPLVTKINKLLELTVSGTWRRFSFVSLGTFLVAVPAAFLVAAWAGSTADRTPASFILLSDKSKKRKQKLVDKSRREWLHLAAAFLSSVGAGIIANWAFQSLLASSMASGY